VGATLPWPLFALADERGRETGYACVQGPARNAAEAEALAAIASRTALIGMTGYGRFPAEGEPRDSFDYAGACLAWCHCFREPERYLPGGKPTILLSHSDFTDYSLASSQRLYPRDDGRKDFDFVYVCQPGSWSERTKNWALARRCLAVLCRDMKLSGVLVGREKIADLPDAGSGRVTTLPRLPWRELMGVFLRSRFLLVTSEEDASPRIITESLSMGTPVLVNRHIIGGWKYVNPFTGAFFESERDIAAGVRACLERWTSPRRWFIANHGPLIAGRALCRFLAGIDSGLRGINRLQISFTMPCGRAAGG
jgi:glycosyltransferase involved in cell wall biosynthesis